MKKINGKQTQDARDELYAIIMRMGNTSTQAAAKSVVHHNNALLFKRYQIQFDLTVYW